MRSSAYNVHPALFLYRAKRYDVKGRKHIGSPLKFYYSDVGLRNARLNFRQQEENRIMENLICNELHLRDFDVDVGIVTHDEEPGRRADETLRLRDGELIV